MLKEGKRNLASVWAVTKISGATHPNPSLKLLDGLQREERRVVYHVHIEHYEELF